MNFLSFFNVSHLSSHFPTTAGSYDNTNSIATTCQPCAPGYISTAGSTACQLCPAGTYGTLSGISCLQCGSCTYSTVGSSSCSPCPYGQFSQAGSIGCNVCTGLTQPARSLSLPMVGSSSNVSTTIDNYHDHRQLISLSSSKDATCIGAITGASNRIIPGCAYCAGSSSCCTSPTADPTIYGWCANNWSSNCPDGTRAECASYNCEGKT